MSVYKGTPTKDGRCYYFRKSKNGKQFTSKKYLTKEECEKAESKFILKNDNPINKRFDLVAEEYFEYMYKVRKESTVYCYENVYKLHIYPYFKSSYINHINIQDIRNWTEIIEKKGLSIRYLNKAYDILKTIFDYGIRNYELIDNPVQKYGRFQVKQDKVIKDEEKLRYITLEEFNQFISVVQDDLWRTFFYTLYYTGIRKSEIQALTWNDIDFNENEIIVNKIISIKTAEKFKITSTKNNQNRRIKMSKTLRKILFEYKKEMIEYTDYTDNWYVFGGTRFLPQTTIDRKKHQFFLESGVKEITIHEFRHSHVTLCINEYIEKCRKLKIKIDAYKFLMILGARMGHSIYVMIKIYMHLFPTVQDEIVDLLNNL